MIFLLILFNLLCLVVIYNNRRRIKATVALAERLQRFLDETQANWSADQTRWQQRIEDVRNHMAVVDEERLTVFAGPKAMTNSDYELMAWRVVRLEHWSHLPID